MKKKRIPERHPASPNLRRDKLLGIGAILLAGTICYLNSFQGAFVLDDHIRILNNPLIQSLKWPWTFMENVRRPFFYLTLALNDAVCGNRIFGYHLVNLLIHLAAGVCLFMTIHLTCGLARFRNFFHGRPMPFSLLAALVWLIHPLQTQSVTYITQRAESLAGLAVLLTLFGSARYFLEPRRTWLVLAAGSCLAGTLTKETAVVAPLLVLLYDRCFISGTFSTAVKKHKTLYLGLGISWLAMACLLLTVHPVEVTPTAGFGLAGISPREYALTQTQVIPHYLKLCFWPRPLVFDYEWPPVAAVSEALPGLTLILTLIAASLLALRRAPALGFLGTSFFVLLLPSSSFIPLKDMAFEYRMYLPLAPVVILGLLATVRVIRMPVLQKPWLRPAVLICTLGVIGLLGGLTAARNRLYSDPALLWQDVLKHNPDHIRANNNLGRYLFDRGKIEEGLALMRKSVSHNTDPRAHVDFGAYLLQHGKTDEARTFFERALELDPEYPDALLNLGIVCSREGRIPEAIRMYQEVIRIEPGYAVAYINLGALFADQGQYDKALPLYHKALALGFEEAGLHHNLGIAYAMTGQPREAVNHLRQALRLNPNLNEARRQLEEILSKWQDTVPPSPEKK